MFQREGIPFFAIAYSGTHNGKFYPQAYTEEEKELIGLTQASRYWSHQIEPHVNRTRNFRGIPCIGGHRLIYISAEGGLHRCVFDKNRVLAAPLQAAEPCGVGHCGCGLFLEKLNTTTSFDFYNGWAGVAGLELLETGWTESFAQSLGYADAQDALAVEGKRIYDALVAAYGREEFPE
jgi:hypothetical protein